MKGNGSDVVNAVAVCAHCLLVQRLNVAKSVSEAQAGNLDFVGGEAVEHEGVVGIWAVGDADFAGFNGGKARQSFLPLNLVIGFVLIRFRRAVLGIVQPLAHANVCRQSGPHHSPGGAKHDQKPPDHPHGIKDTKLWRAVAARRRKCSGGSSLIAKYGV